MKPARAVALSVLAGVLVGAPPLLAQEQPLVAGSDGVPVPKKTKVVKPVYPAEALAQGLRGIVILDLLIDAQGRVASTSVVRSVPGLDEAAIAAARQWEYEPTKVDGKAVSVRLTVPITFTLALPALARDSGIPELRQGISPASQGSEAGNAAAEVTLEGDGRVGAARVVEGQEPFAGALLAALQTWRFSPPPEDTTVSFRVEAQFTPARGSDPARVALKASGLQRSDVLTPPPSPQAASPAPTEPAAEAALPAASPQAAPPAGAAAPAPTAAAPPQAPTPVAAPGPAGPPAEAQPNPRQAGSAVDAGSPTTGTKAAQGAPLRQTAPPATAPPAATPPAAAPGSSPVPERQPGTAKPAAASPQADRSAPPSVEVITAPPPPQLPENGVSAIRDVTLEPGVPDLTRGRRPVSPPLARMAGAMGTVDVAFSVSAAGTTLVQSVSGPDLLKKAAEQDVASWVFRRTRADRAYLTATFTFGADKTAAIVRPQQAPAGGNAAPTAGAVGATPPPPPTAPAQAQQQSVPEPAKPQKP